MLGGNSRREARLRALMVRDGGLLAAFGAAAQLPLAVVIILRQPAEVRAGLAASPPCQVAAGLWLVLAGVAMLWGLLAVLAGPKALTAGGSLRGWAAAAPALAVLLTAAMTIVRDGLRDLCLRAQGFDVWAFQVVPNLGVPAIFLVLVVLTLAIVGVLVAIALKAAPREEVANP